MNLANKYIDLNTATKVIGDSNGDYTFVCDDNYAFSMSLQYLPSTTLNDELFGAPGVYSCGHVKYGGSYTAQNSYTSFYTKKGDVVTGSGYPKTESSSKIYRCKIKDMP